MDIIDIQNINYKILFPSHSAFLINGDVTFRFDCKLHQGVHSDNISGSILMTQEVWKRFERNRWSSKCFFCSSHYSLKITLYGIDWIGQMSRYISLLFLCIDIINIINHKNINMGNINSNNGINKAIIQILWLVLLSPPDFFSARILGLK